MNKTTFKLNNYDIDLYVNNLDSLKELPLFILNSYKNEKIDEVIDSIKGKYNFIFLDIKVNDWSETLTPYKVPDNGIYLRNLDGKGENHLRFIDDTLIPYIKDYLSKYNINISKYILLGYSLAGLFAVFAGLKSKYINIITSISGSLWYPNLINYINDISFNNNIEFIYLSLGDNEKKTKNEYMKYVEVNTLKLFEAFKSIYKNVYFEFNKGNHFARSNERVIKALYYLFNNVI